MSVWCMLTSLIYAAIISFGTKCPKVIKDGERPKPLPVLYNLTTAASVSNSSDSGPHKSA